MTVKLPRQLSNWHVDFQGRTLQKYNVLHSRRVRLTQLHQHLPSCTQHCLNVRYSQPSYYYAQQPGYDVWKLYQTTLCLSRCAAHALVFILSAQTYCEHINHMWTRFGGCLAILTTCLHRASTPERVVHHSVVLLCSFDPYLALIKYNACSNCGRSRMGIYLSLLANPWECCTYLARSSQLHFMWFMGI